MALRKVLGSEPETPYSRPPPVHVFILAVRDEPKVISWHFGETGEATPAVTKNNKMAVITDGDVTSKISLFETFASKVAVNQAYIMRGYSLRGQSPPFGINVTKDTQFFKSAPLEVSEDLRREGQKLLSPPSTLTHLATRDARGLLTVEGEVVELSTIKKVLVGKDAVPLRRVTLEQDKTRVCLSMWREAALLSLAIGTQARVTHVKGSVSGYGYCLQSTAYTVLEETTTTATIGALGTVELEGRPGILKLLVDGDKVLEIKEDQWLPLERQMKKVPFLLSVTLSGTTVMEAKAFEGEDSEDI